MNAITVLLCAGKPRISPAPNELLRIANLAQTSPRNYLNIFSGTSGEDNDEGSWSCAFCAAGDHVIMLLAFTLQTYITQTHIHGLARTSLAAATQFLDKSQIQKQQPAKLPLGNDQANCPICQGIQHAGYFVAPSVSALLLPTVLEFIAPVVVNVNTRGTLSPLLNRPAH